MILAICIHHNIFILSCKDIPFFQSVFSDLVVNVCGIGLRDHKLNSRGDHVTKKEIFTTVVLW